MFLAVNTVQYLLFMMLSRDWHVKKFRSGHTLVRMSSEEKYIMALMNKCGTMLNIHDISSLKLRVLVLRCM